MRVGMIGTGAISHKHAQVYANIGYELAVCTDINADSGRDFAQRYGCSSSQATKRSAAIPALITSMSAPFRTFVCSRS